jgi:predicted AAA+ superfamily ATPase
MKNKLISLFEDTYLMFSIPRFSYSYRQQQVNPKKVYSIDTGFSVINSPSFSKDKGRLLENIVFLNLRRKFKNILYFQERNECDFIVKEAEKIKEVIQVCYDFNQDNQDREINGSIEAMEKFKLKEGLILTYNQTDEINVRGVKIKVLPVWKWLLSDKI